MAGTLIEAVTDYHNTEFSQNPSFQTIHPDFNPLWKDVATIEQRVYGQGEAALSVARAAVRVKAGLASRRGPEYVGFFLGTPGTGKTEMGAAIGDLYWGPEGETHVKIINCAAFYGEHTVSKLVGAATGYLG